MSRDEAARSSDPLAAAALRFALAATSLVLVAAAVGASVRLLPWVLDPRIGKETLAPFVRSLAVVAVEVAVLTGWPMGWALAAHRLVDRGEARVFASLGESPARIAQRLLVQGVVFAVVLALTSFALGRMSAAPGRVVGALLREGHDACARATAPAANTVPIAPVTWLCGAEGSPRIAGRSPIGGLVFTASDARVSDDLRRIDLDDARVRAPGPSGADVHVHVATLTLRGMAPFTAASPLAPIVRAVVVVLAGVLSAVASVLALLRARRLPGAVVAAGIGALGPVTALGALRALELRMPEGDASAGWLVLVAAVPFTALAAVLVGAAVSAAISERRSALGKT